MTKKKLTSEESEKLERYKLAGVCVQRLSDGAFIPKDETNTDYQNYLIWLSDGNQPEGE